MMELKDCVVAGGDPGRLLLCGNSSGAHLLALLALDHRWLSAAGCPQHAIAGVIDIR